MTRMGLGLLLTAVMALSAAAHPKLERSLSEGQDCPSRAGYPASRCQTIKNCPNVVQYIVSTNMTLNDVVQCGLTVFVELICCPKEPPEPSLQAVSSTTQSRLPAGGQRVPQPERVREPYGHVTALQYLAPQTLDSYIFRCTGFLLKENFVLTSAACAGSLMEEPNHVRLGPEEPFGDSREINNITYHGNDLVLLRTSQGYGREFIAEICRQEDLDNRRKLVAVGFSQKNGENCQWFEQEVNIAPFARCDRVSINRLVTGIDPVNHFCVAPAGASPPPPPGSCVPCLRGSASGLHVIRGDGTVCLAGVATPTSKACAAGTKHLYYTSLLGPRNSRFLNDMLQVPAAAGFRQQRSPTY
ncbi:uncharacterized protein LOC111081428 [Drosophila obscura]|uniref:uncharacterized protein LOC111081428 n=1 Tax=Drosophila obscura TaxID=7282 RepID=UPI001BB17CC4|nr:uncharacterized protein LOC111081428 [Drosophila obscura]